MEETRCPACNGKRGERQPVEKIITGGPYRALLHLKGWVCFKCGYALFDAETDQFITRTQNRLFDADFHKMLWITTNFYEVWGPE